MGFPFLHFALIIVAVTNIKQNRKDTYRMELIKISNTKLKMILTDADLSRYHICAQTFDYANKSDRQAFRKILDDARQSVGFDSSHSGLDVRFYPSRAGGCEIYVTKTAPSVIGAEQLIPRTDFSEGTALFGGSLCGSFDEGRDASAYSFEQMEMLLRVCRILRRNKHSGKSTAYRDRSGKYYLVLFDTLSALIPAPDSTTFLCEFGRKENANALLLYVREHGIPVCEKDAIQILGRL